MKTIRYPLLVCLFLLTTALFATQMNVVAELFTAQT